MARSLQLRGQQAVGLAAAVISMLVFSGCAGAAGSDAAPDGLRVVTTVAPLTSIVSNIGGDRVNVIGVIPEGTNSHTFEPAPSAVRALSRADVVFVNGLQLEEAISELARQNLKPDGEIIELGTTVLPKKDYIFDFSFPKEEGKPNPHLWTDPTYVIRYAAVVRDVLSRRDAQNKGHYEANFDAFRAKAEALSSALRADQNSIAADRRTLVTYHDAYAYFARSYGWKVLGAVQPKDFEDPTPKEIVRLIEQIRDSQVPVIFGSEVFPSKVLEQIARESGARYEDTLRDDDLPGRPGDEDHSLLGLLRYDFITMIEGLGGTADELRQVDVGDVARDRAEYPQ